VFVNVCAELSGFCDCCGKWVWPSGEPDCQWREIAVELDACIDVWRCTYIGEGGPLGPAHRSTRGGLPRAGAQ
jgi:hypothetical protein